MRQAAAPSRYPGEPVRGSSQAAACPARGLRQRRKTRARRLSLITGIRLMIPGARSRLAGPTAARWSLRPEAKSQSGPPASADVHRQRRRLLLTWLLICSRIPEDFGAPDHQIRRLCRACYQPGHLMAGLPGRFSLARIVFHRCAVLYGQNQATFVYAVSG